MYDTIKSRIITPQVDSDHKTKTAIYACFPGGGFERRVKYSVI
jgi:hypothetical protein